MAAPEIATAYISVIPSMRDVPGLLRSGFVGPSGDAGGAAGNAAGQGFASRLGPAMKAGVAAAAAAAGAALVYGVTQAIDRGRIQNRLQAQLGATRQDAERFGDVAGQLYAKGITENFQQGADAVRQVMSGGLAPPDATIAQLEEIAGTMTDVSNTFGYDMEWMGKSVSAMLRNDMAGSATEALDAITYGLQNLGPNAEDLLETFQEYSVQLRTLGLDAEESLGLFQQGLQAGARDTDIVADALKEFAIRAVDMSTTSREAYEILGLSATEMEAQIMQGGEGATAGLQLVLDKLREMGPTTEREAAAVGLFGTQAEELNDALFALDPSHAVQVLGDVGGAAAELGDTLHQGPGHEIEVFRRRLETELVDFAGNTVIPALTDVANFFQDDLAPAISSGASAVGDAASGAWGWLTDIPAVSGLQDDVAGAVTELGNLGPAFEGAGTTVQDTFLPAMRSAGDYISDQLEPVIGTVADFAQSHLVDAFSDMAGRIGDFGAKLWPVSRAIMTFQGAIVAVVLWLTSKLAPVLGWLAGPIFDAFQKGITATLTPIGWLVDAVTAVGRGAIWLWEAVQPGGAILNALADAAGWCADVVRSIGDAFAAMWRTAQPVLSTAWTVIKNVFTAIVVGAITPLVAAIGGIGTAAWALWEFAIKPAVDSIGDAFLWLYSHAVKPAADGVGSAVRWLNETIIQPAFRGILSAADALERGFDATFTAIGDVIDGTWRNVIQPSFRAVHGGFEFLRDGAVWFRDSVVGPVWDWIADKTDWLWDKGIRPSFDAIKDGVDAVADAFEGAKDMIGDAWEGIKSLVATPVKWVIDTVYNNGIRRLWNTVAGAVGASELGRISFEYADGGILPGYTPGRDVHVAALSGGEAVMRPEWTRAVGPEYVHSMNALAKSQGVAGVRSAMGGGLPAFADGGIIGSIGNALGSAVDWARETGAGWIGDRLRDLIDGIASRIPGADTGWGQLIARVPGAFVGKITDFISGREADAGGTWRKPLGSPIGTRYGVAGRMWASGRHTGTDFPAPTGTAIKAVADGIVSAVGNGGPYGRHMRLAHPGGYQSFYAHMSATLRSVGQAISRGETIGRVGSTGNSTGPHLHLEAFRNGQRINPESLFDNGGWLQPGAQLTRNETGRPEPVLTSQQWSDISSLAAGGAAGLRPGDRLILSVDGRREFEAYVDGRAESAAERTITTTLARPAGIGRRHV